MPEAPLTPDRRRVTVDPDSVEPPARSSFVELGLVSCFSFLRGASDAVSLVETAYELGYDAIGIADVNSMAGVVRIHAEARALKLRPVIGCRIETVEGLTFLAYPQDRAAYGRLCALISAGRMGTLDGEWQDKGVCEISLAMLAARGEGVHLVLVPPRDLEERFTIAVESNVVALGGEGAQAPALLERTGTLDKLLPDLAAHLPGLGHIAACYLHVGDDVARIAQLDALARGAGLSLLATNDVLYHAWADDSSGERVDNNYLKLFIELEALIENALKADLHDKHSKMRGWTPPPKGYAEELQPDEKPNNTKR